ncbi:hypothetical protein GCM10009764_06680 [Nocardia ninae]|uniref:Uncharacterized protein n=1 Tax=Nocardia ninae NBRC 108245 TaxID=1210091 RepID=A0A511MU12_9NOCA|nr:hypothetical protein NN4_85980 [Nocardia ninae NBRC 108245]
MQPQMPHATGSMGGSGVMGGCAAATSGTVATTAVINAVNTNCLGMWVPPFAIGEDESSARIDLG